MANIKVEKIPGKYINSDHQKFYQKVFAKVVLYDYGFAGELGHMMFQPTLKACNIINLLIDKFQKTSPFYYR